jgi:hypothetical protein
MSQARAIGLFSALFTGGLAMTRSNSVSMLRRAYECVVASLGALSVTALMLFSVNAQAAAPSVTASSVTPSVTILVPTVTIEVVDETPHASVQE